MDILVIMPLKGSNPEKATEIWMATKPKFPIDIIVRKPTEIKKRLDIVISSCMKLSIKAKSFMKPLTREGIEKAENSRSELTS